MIKLANSRRVQFQCPKPLLDYLNTQAVKYCAGNRSEYLRHLVLQDLRTQKVRIESTHLPQGEMDPKGNETEAERQARLDKKRKQALALANPAVAQALKNVNFQTMRQELTGALKAQKQKQHGNELGT